MLAYHNDPAIKAKYIARLAAHRAADELRKGATGFGGKGCAVWCTLDRYSHEGYEIELGIPRGLAHLEDYIFEALPLPASMEWPARFLAAIKPGADLSRCVTRFLLWTLIDEKSGVRQYLTAEGLPDFDSSVRLLERDLAGERPTPEEWDAAARDAVAWAAAARAAAAESAADKLIEILEAAA